MGSEPSSVTYLPRDSQAALEGWDLPRKGRGASALPTKFWNSHWKLQGEQLSCHPQRLVVAFRRPLAISDLICLWKNPKKVIIFNRSDNLNLHKRWSLVTDSNKGQGIYLFSHQWVRKEIKSEGVGPARGESQEQKTLPKNRKTIKSGKWKA